MERAEDVATLRPGSTRLPLAKDTSRGRVLLVEDDQMLGRSMARTLKAEGYDCDVAYDVSEATSLLLEARFDVVLADIQLPDGSGIDLLRMLRAYDLDLPVLLHTGNPTLETAIQAVELGALRYLVKPVDREALLAAISRAVRLRKMARLKREALRLAGEEGADNPGDRAGLASRFEMALETLWMAFQPIVDLRKKTVFGYEALLRSHEPSLPTPPDVVHAAERLGRVYELGRVVRERAARVFEQIPNREVALFVNLHATELLDPDLYDGSTAFGALADRIVLEVTERSAIEKVHDVQVRTSVLRYNGFKLAIDDLGAGYAGLTSFVTLEPEIVKLDMSLVRHVDDSKIRQQLVRSVADLCGQLGMRCVAEGIETAAELRCIRMLGCDFGQGFYIGRPVADPQPASALTM